jgi:SAM-dependent methyltransferase
LLDLACGRGGDLHKWQAAGVRFVKGVDLSPAEVTEAQRRYGELVRGGRGGGGSSGRVPECEFVQSDHLGDAEWRDGVLGGGAEGDDPAPAHPPQPQRQYDCVTCMFALHYFFEREQSLRRFLDNVALNLKPGGYFVGTCPDGKRVQAALKGATGDRYEAPMLRLARRWGSGKPAAFGSAYTMEILDTVVQGHRGGGEGGGDGEGAANADLTAPPPATEGSDEFLVFPGVLEAAAAAAGLKPVAGPYGDPALDALFEAKDAGSAFKHFQPTYPPGTCPSLADASRLNMAFAFRKVDSAEEAVPPPLVAAGAQGGAQVPPQQMQMQQQQQPIMMMPPAAMMQAGVGGVLVPGPGGMMMPMPMPMMMPMDPQQQQQMLMMQQQQQMLMMQQQQQMQMQQRRGPPTAWQAARERLPGRFYADPRVPPLLPPPTVGVPPGQRDYGAQQEQEAAARAARLDVYADRLRARAVKAAEAAAGGAGGSAIEDEAARAAARAAAAAALAKAAAEKQAGAKRKRQAEKEEEQQEQDQEEEQPEPEADADEEGPARPAKRPAPAAGPAVDAAAMYGDLDDDDDGLGGGGGAGGGGGGYAGDF